MRKEVIHLEPYVVLYHDFVSDLEAQKIRGLAEPWVSVPKALPELPFVPGVQKCENGQIEQLDTLSVQKLKMPTIP